MGFWPEGLGSSLHASGILSWSGIQWGRTLPIALFSNGVLGAGGVLPSAQSRDAKISHAPIFHLSSFIIVNCYFRGH